MHRQSILGANAEVDWPYPESTKEMRQGAKDFNVPGIAVAVVKDGRVVYERAFGLRTVDSIKPIDRRTKYCIASITKSFTATSLELLADRGQLKMDDKVIDHLPWFHMSDLYVTRELRLRGLRAHRSGLGPHAVDLLFLPGTTYSNREVVERLGELPLATWFSRQLRLREHHVRGGFAGSRTQFGPKLCRFRTRAHFHAAAHVGRRH